MHVSPISPALEVSAVIERKPLADGLAIVMNAIEKRAALPVLSQVRIKSGDIGAELTASNSELEISVRIPRAIDPRMDLLA